VDLLNKLAADIGFSYTLYKVRDEKWGIKTVGRLVLIEIIKFQKFRKKAGTD